MLPGNHAVEVFFMISGFYMSLVLSSKYAGDNGLKKFYLNRFVRLYPVYLLVLLATWAWFFFSWYWLDTVPVNAWIEPYQEMPFLQKLGQIVPNWIMIGNDIRCIFHYRVGEGFLPFHYYHPGTAPDGAIWAGFFGTISQAWSIGSEIWFYMLAPWLARMKPPLLLCAGALAFGLKGWMEASGLPTYFFTPVQIAFFISGMLVHRGWKTFLTDLHLPRLGWSLVAALAMFTVLFPFIEMPFKQWTYYIAFAAALPLVFSASKTNRLDRWLGNLSYPFYMVHMLAVSVVPAVLGKEHGNLPTLVFTLLSAVLLARYVETPVDEWRQRPMLRFASR